MTQRCFYSFQTFRRSTPSSVKIVFYGMGTVVDLCRGQLLFPSYKRLTKALIVETFEKNKNIFVSPIASFVNHCYNILLAVKRFLEQNVSWFNLPCLQSAWKINVCCVLYQDQIWHGFHLSADRAFPTLTTCAHAMFASIQTTPALITAEQVLLADNNLSYVCGPVVQWLVQRFRSERLRVRSLTISDFSNHRPGYSGFHFFYAKLWTVTYQKPMVKKVWKKYREWRRSPRNSAQYERVVELWIMHKAKWTPRQIPLLPSVSQARSIIRQLQKSKD